jgi:endonuclease/exonuclease/phosphatase family metal-dependent hydrolase
MRRALLCLATIGALGVAGCAKDPPLRPHDPTPGAVHFVVMTYNVNLPHLASATIDAIGAPNADVVCLQEVGADWRKIIEPRYASQYPNMMFATNETEGGLAMLSRYPIHDRGLIALPGNAAQWHPGSVVDVDTPGGTIEIVNVHLRAIFEGNSNPITNYFDRGSDHIQELSTFFGHTNASMPIVVAGDFNEGPTGDGVKSLESRGFLNVLPAFHPGQFTWRSNSVGAAAELTEDYLFFDGRFDPLDAWVARIGGSDHLPVLAHVQLRAPIGAPPSPATSGQN